MRRIAARADLASRSRSPVWLVGGPGTGKETLARAIHFHGITREQSFIGIDCAGLQPYLIMSLLFGHNGLAETGRVGTVYLRSPEAMPADLQAELVEWHQMTDEVPRVVVGTTGAAGLSEDFRATFGVIEIALPLLAERKPELPRILAEVLDEERAAGVPTAGCASDAEAVLMAWTWPGNLREFRDTVRGAARLAEGSRIEVAHLPHAVRRGVAEASAANSGAVPALTAPKLDAVLEQVERRMIDLALRKSKGDQTAAAELLGVYRSRLVRRIKALEIG